MPKRRRATPVERLTAKLEALGYKVEGIYPTRGYWTHATQDCIRWEARVTPADSASQITLTSWDSVTACARGGFTFSLAGTTMSGYHEIHAAPRRKKES